MKNQSSLFLNSVFIKSQICSNALDKFPDHSHLIFVSFGRFIQCLFVCFIALHTQGVIIKVEQVLSHSKCQRLT